MAEDGRLRPGVRRVLENVRRGATENEIVAGLRLPVHRVRASLREAARAGLVEAEHGVFRLTAKGAEAVLKSGARAPGCDERNEAS